MAHVTADFVKETSTTTGTGPIVLGGARAPAQTFAAVCSNGDTVHYAISHDTLNQWEVGTGTYSSGGNSITRSVVLSSSSGGAAVNFAAGTKRVDLVEPAARIVQQVGPVQIGATSFGSGALSFSNLNGVSWGLATNSAGGTITASINAGGGATSFSNANNVSFGLAGSTITASAPTLFEVVTNLSAVSLSDMAAATSINASRIAFRGIGGLTSVFSSQNVAFALGTNATNYLAGAAWMRVSANVQAFDAQNISFSNANGISWTISTTTAANIGLVAVVNASVVPALPVTLAFIASTFSGFTEAGMSATRLNLNAGFTSAQSLFSSCNVSFGISGTDRIAAVAGINVMGPGGTAFAQHFSFLNTNGVSWTIDTTSAPGFGRVGLIQASVGGVAAVNLSAGSTSANTTQIRFSNAGGMVWGLSGGSVVTARAQIGLSVGTDFLFQSNIGFSDANGASWGVTAPAGTQITIQYQAPRAISAGTEFVTNGTVVFSNANGVSFGLSAGTLTASVAAGGGGGGFATVSLANGFGTTSPAITAATDVSVSGGLLAFHQLSTSANTNISYNNVAFRLSSNTLLGAAFIRFLGGTVTDGLDAQNFSLVNSFGNSWAFATLSASSRGLIPLVALRAAIAVSAGTSASQFLHSIVLSDSNNVSFGMSGSTLTASASFAQSAQPALTVSAAGSSVSAGSLVFSNSNGFSFGMNGSTITGAAPEILGLVSHVGGTSVADVSRLVFENAFNVNWLINSAPGAATVQASAVGGGAAVTFSGYTPYDEAAVSMNQVGQSAFFIQPLVPPNFTHDRIVLPVYISNTNSNFSASIRWQMGIYTRGTGASSTLLSLSVGSTFSTSISYTSASTGNFSGWRNMSFGWSASMSEGNYWIGIGSTTGGGTGTLSNIVKAPIATSFRGYWGSVSADGQQLSLGYGLHATTQTVAPGSIAFSAILGANSLPRINAPRFHFGFGSV